MYRFIESDKGIMRARAIFQKVKTFCDAQGYTISQIENATDQQVKNALNLTDDEFQEYRRLVPSIKNILIEDLKEKEDYQTLMDLKSQVNAYLLPRFPDYEFEKDFSDKTDRKIIIHLDGIR
jgi:hypothetical protein